MNFARPAPRRYGGRWTPRGVPAINTAPALSLAMLEMLVNTPPGRLPGQLEGIASTEAHRNAGQLLLVCPSRRVVLTILP